MCHTGRIARAERTGRVCGVRTPWGAVTVQAVELLLLLERQIALVRLPLAPRRTRIRRGRPLRFHAASAGK
jgi:hypothetical protein